MVDEAVTLPEPRPEDDEDVVWGLSTATALWARGERGDAVVWLRRAVSAAEAVGQAARATELRLATDLLEHGLDKVRHETMPPPPPSPGDAGDDAPRSVPTLEEKLAIEIEPAATPPAQFTMGASGTASTKPSTSPGTLRPPPSSGAPPPSSDAIAPAPGSLSSPPAARAAASKRAPMLDPWAEEPTLPSLRVDTAIRTVQVEGDEVMVQMRAGTPRAPVDDDDGVITSAAPLRATLGVGARPHTPPTRKWTATGEQPPGHIAEAGSGIPTKTSGPPPAPPAGDAAPVEAAASDAASTVAAPPIAPPAPIAAPPPPPPAAPPPPAPIAAPPPAPIAAPPPALIAAPPAPLAPIAAPPAPLVAPPAPLAPIAAPPAPLVAPPAPVAAPIAAPPPAPIAASPEPAPAPAPVAAPPPPGPPVAATLPSFAVSTASAAATPNKTPAAKPPVAPAPKPAPAAAPQTATGGPAVPRPGPPAGARTVPRPGGPASVRAPAAASPSTLPPSAPRPEARPAPRPAAGAAAKPSITPPRAAPAATNAQAAAAGPAPAAAPASPAVLDAHVLDGVEAFADVPVETRGRLASLARIETLSPGEEISAFGAALLVDGSATVSATIVDAAVSSAAVGALVPARGTFAEAIALRVVAGPSGARAAVWEHAAIEETLRSCPWVLEELAATADRLQALAGATMGAIGELEQASRDRVLGRLVMRTVPARDPIAADGASAAVVCVGTVDVGEGDARAVVRAGEVLFPRASTGEVRAGAQGAILLVGDRAVADELAAGPPSLAAVFAAR